MDEIKDMLDLAVWLAWSMKDKTTEQVCKAKSVFNKDPGGVLAAADVSQDARDDINRVFDWILKRKQEGLPII